MARPKNPTSYWNRLDGKELPDLPHVIEDIRMRPNECWVLCTCGWRKEAGTPESLQMTYATHINYAQLEAPHD